MTHQTTSEPRREQTSYTYAFLLLAVFTLAEVGIYYLPDLPDAIKIGLWVFLGAAKVALVLLFFMHLKSDKRIFDIPIALGIVSIIPLVLIVTLTAPQAVQAQGSGAGSGNAGSGGNAAAAAPSGPTSVDVTETNFKISLSTATVPAGKVTFHVTNKADSIPHQFAVIKSDQPADQLPTSNGKVDTTNLNVIGSTDNIQTGKNQDLTVDLSAGKYVVICNLPSHYQNGMYATFTVTGQQGQAQQGQAQQGQAQQGQAQQGQAQQGQTQQGQTQQGQTQQGQTQQGQGQPAQGGDQQNPGNGQQSAQSQQPQQVQPPQGSLPANGATPLIVVVPGAAQAAQISPMTITVTPGELALVYNLSGQGQNGENLRLTVQIQNSAAQGQPAQPQAQQGQTQQGQTQQGQTQQGQTQQGQVEQSQTQQNQAQPGQSQDQQGQGNSPQSSSAQQPSPAQRPPSQQANSVQRVDVTETSFKISLASASIAPGKVTFHITNQAQDLPHQFELIKTDQPTNQLPLSNGMVDTSNLNVVANTDNIHPGASQDLTVDLTPGTYVLLCNLPGHYQQGMYAGLTVQGQPGQAQQ